MTVAAAIEEASASSRERLERREEFVAMEDVSRGVG
jgi:hypothetical protein